MSYWREKNRFHLQNLTQVCENDVDLKNLIVIKNSFYEKFLETIESKDNKVIEEKKGEFFENLIYEIRKGEKVSEEGCWEKLPLKNGANYFVDEKDRIILTAKTKKEKNTEFPIQALVFSSKCRVQELYKTQQFVSFSGETVLTHLILNFIEKDILYIKEVNKDLFPQSISLFFGINTEKTNKHPFSLKIMEQYQERKSVPRKRSFSKGVKKGEMSNYFFFNINIFKKNNS